LGFSFNVVFDVILMYGHILWRTRLDIFNAHSINKSTVINCCVIVSWLTGNYNFIKNFI